MNDDWRLRITLEDDDTADALTERLKEHTTSNDRSRSMHDRIVVSRDGAEVFCYAGTRDQADATLRAVEQLAADAQWAAPQFELTHWHPTAERWEDADLPLPQTDAERAEELRQRIAQERTDSERQGYPDFEVRVHCGSRGEAGDLADRLRHEGIPVVHRWSAVLVGASDEASAAQLAERLRAEVPADSTVTVEGNMRATYDDRPWSPFSVLGGLGG
jgi:L-alanine-DL-glutamate epimerase-like enolase superfamily enzyme